MASSWPVARLGHFANLALDQVAFQYAYMTDVKPAVQVIGFVQERSGQQVLPCHLEWFSLGVLRLDRNALAARNLLAESRDTETPFLTCLRAFDTHDLRVDEYDSFR